MKEKENNENVKEWQKCNDKKQESLIWKKPVTKIIVSQQPLYLLSCDPPHFSKEMEIFNIIVLKQIKDINTHLLRIIDTIWVFIHQNISNCSVHFLLLSIIFIALKSSLLFA
jgi:hypothetical protein